MATSCNRFMSRSSLSSLKSAIKSTTRPSPAAGARSAFAAKPTSSPRFSISRTPSELGCVASMLPLHSAVASARMTSCLSTNSRSCRALSQGILCCTSPDL